MRRLCHCDAYVRHSVRRWNFKQAQVALLSSFLPTSQYLRNSHDYRRSSNDDAFSLDIQRWPNQFQIQLWRHPLGLPRPCGGAVPTADPLPILQQPPKTHPLPLIRRG